MADLGDLTSFMKEGSVADLEWLHVDAEEYRQTDRLPKQNLDIGPDLVSLWDHSDKPQTIVPNYEAKPQTMGDLSEVHGKLASDETLQKVVKVARLALMQSTDLAKFRNALVTRFDSSVLNAARTVLAQIIGERGLIGSYYIDAIDFPNCTKAGKDVSNFVKHYASSARFVVAKDKCTNCVNCGTHCAVFQKELVLEVPYTEALAGAVEQAQSAQGKVVQASTSAPRERIKAAYLADDLKIAEWSAPKPVVNPAQFMRPTVETAKVHLPVIASHGQRLTEESMAWNPSTSSGRTASEKTAFDRKAFDVVTFLRREMLKGHGEKDLLQSLKLSFSLDDLRNTRQVWESVFKEAGYFGTVYATQDSFNDCHEGADFIAKFNPTIKGIVASAKCSGCLHGKMSRCQVYGKPLVARAEDLYTPSTVALVIHEHRLAGRLGSEVKWGSAPAEALKEIYRVASGTSRVASTSVRSYVEQAFSGADHGHITAGLTKREIVTSASRYLNEGLYGDDLLSALRRRFDPRDITASLPELKVVLAEQGLQGIHFIDPTVYADYGRGCDEGMRLHRARLVPYLKTGPKCASCVLRNNQGQCSKYAKPLVVEPPYVDKAAQQREMLASGKSTEVSFSSLVNSNTKSIVADFHMNSTVEFDLNPEPTKSATVTVELGGASIDL